MSIDIDTWENADVDPKTSIAIMKYLVRKLFGRLFMSSSKPSKPYGCYGVFTLLVAVWIRRRASRFQLFADWGLTHIHVARRGMLDRGFFRVAATRSKIVAGNHWEMIGVGAIVAVLAGKVNVVNAGDKFTKSQGPLLGVGFHDLIFTPENCANVMGYTPHRSKYDFCVLSRL